MALRHYEVSSPAAASASASRVRPLARRGRTVVDPELLRVSSSMAADHADDAPTAGVTDRETGTALGLAALLGAALLTARGDARPAAAPSPATAAPTAALLDIP